ncbi:peptide deformylase [Antarctobacter heliothermus]|uniref:Peptide deformylase n=1 Tax=Antarctobacter heliothermus TaxID=74033 RepID=A0A239I5A8_9RHOB|nr:peptide deformylase [Antarctobacter heliothermus]SNS88709.1 peptide deformylase [Antarctobacter heliothermus]
MSLLPILKWPDPRLAQVCTPVVDPAAVEQLVTDMFETMYAAPGRGLAAPQIGVMARLFVMDAGWKEGDMTPLACLDPRITLTTDATATATEGCLSVPGVTADVTRPAEITLTFTDLTGTAQEVTLTGAAATIAQHELDHLDGIMHFDRIDPAARDTLLADYAKGQGV